MLNISNVYPIAGCGLPSVVALNPSSAHVLLGMKFLSTSYFTSVSCSLKLNLCIDETVDLMNCARYIDIIYTRLQPVHCRNPDKSVCAKQFLAMRECNRVDGPHLYITVTWSSIAAQLFIASPSG